MKLFAVAAVALLATSAQARVAAAPAPLRAFPEELVRPAGPCRAPRRAAPRAVCSPG
jgi:hypothetical protein